MKEQELCDCNAAPAGYDDGRGGKICRACFLILIFLIPVEKEKWLKLVIKQ
jgi:hypothetical protein